jgi:hypothetical protein
MKWNFTFTSKQILSGEVNYSIKDFQKDLKKWSESLFYAMPEVQYTKAGEKRNLDAFYDLEYGIFYLLAIRWKPSDIGELTQKITNKKLTPQENKEIEGIIRYILKNQRDKIDMLQAVLIKRYLDIKNKPRNESNNESIANLIYDKNFYEWAWDNFWINHLGLPIPDGEFKAKKLLLFSLNHYEKNREKVIQDIKNLAMEAEEEKRKREAER